MLPDNVDHDDGVSIRWINLSAMESTPIIVSSTSSTYQQTGFGNGVKRACPCASRANAFQCTGAFASIGSIFSRFGKRDKKIAANAPVAEEGERMVAYSPVRGTYAHEVLQRRFKELDRVDGGYIGEGDLKIALKKLYLPASEEEIQSFLATIKDKTGTSKITLEKFSEYAIQRENQLVDTFKELDKRKTGYLTDDGVKAALRRYRFRVGDKDLEKLVERFRLRGGALSPLSFENHSRGLDFTEYRDCLMLLTVKDLRDNFEIWGRARIDLGDVDTTFPLSSGRYHNKGLFGQHRATQKVLRHLFASAVSSAVSRTAVAPLERCKVLSMLNMQASTESLSLTLSNIWSEEGLRGFFKGNFLNVLSIAPTKAGEYLVYDKLKELVLSNRENVDISRIERVVLGSLSSMAGAFISHPIDTVRTVIMAQVGGPKAGAVESAKTILNANGIYGFYRGIIPNMVRVAPYGAINFILYDELKLWYRKKVGPGGEIGLLPNLVFGVLAGAISQTLVYPVETIQRRLQAQAAQQLPTIHKSMFVSFHKIIQEEGVRALYAGILPNYAKLIPAATISLLVYEAVKEKLDLRSLT